MWTYICAKIKFVNAYRIFVDDAKVFGIIDLYDFLIDPPKCFVDDILSCELCVVEVNHSLALMSYGFKIDLYVKYCRRSWKYFMNILLVQIYIDSKFF